MLPTAPDLVNGGLVLNIPGAIHVFNGVPYVVVPTTQELTLNEAFDAYGRLIQLVGGVAAQPGGGFGTPYDGGPFARRFSTEPSGSGTSTT